VSLEGQRWSDVTWVKTDSAFSGRHPHKRVLPRLSLHMYLSGETHRAVLGKHWGRGRLTLVQSGRVRYGMPQLSRRRHYVVHG